MRTINGFFSIALLFVLQISISVLSLAICKVKQYQQLEHGSNQKQQIELFLIHYVKNALYEYDEKDEELDIFETKINLHYDDIIAYASYQIDHHSYCLKIVYDDIAECIMEVTYLDRICPC